MSSSVRMSDGEQQEDVPPNVRDEQPDPPNAEDVTSQLAQGGVLAPAALTAIRSVLSGREGTGATSTQVERTAAEGSSHSKGSGRLWRALSTRNSASLQCRRSSNGRRCSPDCQGGCNLCVRTEAVTDLATLLKTKPSFHQFRLHQSDGNQLESVSTDDYSRARTRPLFRRVFSDHHSQASQQAQDETRLADDSQPAGKGGGMGQAGDGSPEGQHSAAWAETAAVNTAGQQGMQQQQQQHGGAWTDKAAPGGPQLHPQQHSGTWAERTNNAPRTHTLRGSQQPANTPQPQPASQAAAHTAAQPAWQRRSRLLQPSWLCCLAASQHNNSDSLRFDDLATLREPRGSLFSRPSVRVVPLASTQTVAYPFERRALMSNLVLPGSLGPQNSTLQQQQQGDLGQTPPANKSSAGLHKQQHQQQRQEQQGSVGGWQEGQQRIAAGSGPQVVSFASSTLGPDCDTDRDAQLVSPFRLSKAGEASAVAGAQSPGHVSRRVRVQTHADN